MIADMFSTMKHNISKWATISLEKSQRFTSWCQKGFREIQCIMVYSYKMNKTYSRKTVTWFPYSANVGKIWDCQCIGVYMQLGYLFYLIQLGLWESVYRFMMKLGSTSRSMNQYQPVTLTTHTIWYSMTSWYGDAFCNTDSLWDCPHKGSSIRRFMFSLLFVWTCCWINWFVLILCRYLHIFVFYFNVYFRKSYSHTFILTPVDRMEGYKNVPQIVFMPYLPPDETSYRPDDATFEII